MGLDVFFWSFPVLLATGRLFKNLWGGWTNEPHCTKYLWEVGGAGTRGEKSCVEHYLHTVQLVKYLVCLVSYLHMITCCRALLAVVGEDSAAGVDFCSLGRSLSVPSLVFAARCFQFHMTKLAKLAAPPRGCIQPWQCALWRYSLGTREEA